MCFYFQRESFLKNILIVVIFLISKFDHIQHKMEIVMLLLYLVPSGFPQMFQEESRSSRSLSFSWDVLLPENQNGIVVSYTVNIYEASKGQIAATRQLPSHQLSLIVNNLLPFTNYLCSIAASTSVGVGPFSQNITVITLQSSKSNTNQFFVCRI